MSSDAEGSPGTGVDISHGMPLFEFLALHPERAEGFNAAMSERTAAFAPSVAAGYDFSPMRMVVDMGGGKGTLLAAILSAHPHLRGMLFDLPNVTTEADEVLQAAGVADRCEIRTGCLHPGQRAARLGRQSGRPDPNRMRPEHG